MVGAFAAVAQAAADTVDTVKAAVPTLPQLPRELGNIPAEVWQKLDSDQIADIIEEAVETPGVQGFGVHGVIALLIPFAGIALTGVAIWLLLRLIGARGALRHQETMAMIEKGIYQPPPDKLVYRRARHLVGGVLLGAIGLAFLLSFVLVARSEHGLVIAGLLFFLPGAGLVGLHAFLAKRERESSEPGALPKGPPAETLG